MTKALSAAAQRSAKALPRNRPASTLTLSGSGDIFDAPERPFEEEQSSFLSALQQRYLPSPFCPPANSSYSPSSSSVSKSSWTTTMSAGSSSSAAHYPTHAPSLVFDGPARPRQRLIVTSRNRHSSSSAFTNAVPYAPAVPEIFDGPARPRRRGPSQTSKSEAQLSPATVAGIVALVGLATYQVSQSDDESPQRT